MDRQMEFRRFGTAEKSIIFFPKYHVNGKPNVVRYQIPLWINTSQRLVLAKTKPPRTEASAENPSFLNTQ